MNKLSELKLFINKKGFKKTINRIRDRYLSVTEFILFCNDLEKNDSSFDISPDVNYCLGDMEILKHYREEHPGLPREFYIDQTHAGKEFYLTYYKGELAQICWVFRKGGYSRFYKLTNDDVCEVNYIITLLKFRGKGISANLLNYICNHLKSEHINKVVGAISANNVLMINGMNITGFVELKRVKSCFSFVRKTVV